MGVEEEALVSNGVALIRLRVSEISRVGVGVHDTFNQLNHFKRRAAAFCEGAGDYGLAY